MSTPLFTGPVAMCVESPFLPPHWFAGFDFSTGEAILTESPTAAKSWTNVTAYLQWMTRISNWSLIQIAGKDLKPVPAPVDWPYLSNSAA